MPVQMYISQSRCHSPASDTDVKDSSLLPVCKIRAFGEPWQVWELITPLVSAHAAGASPQQLMSPTLGQGCGTATQPPSHLPEGMVWHRHQVQRQHLHMAKPVEWALHLWLREGHLEA